MGEDGFPALVQKYCEIEIAEGGDPVKVTPLNRRSQILFLTEEAKADGKQNPKLETLLKLADAVGAEISATALLTAIGILGLLTAIGILGLAGCFRNLKLRTLDS